MSEISRVVEIGNEMRKKLLAMNVYKENDQYNINHPNAISNGDSLGRGENQSGVVGTDIDIAQRNKLISANKYKAGKEYNVIE